MLAFNGLVLRWEQGDFESLIRVALARLELRDPDRAILAFALIDQECPSARVLELRTFLNHMIFLPFLLTGKDTVAPILTNRDDFISYSAICLLFFPILDSLLKIR